MYATSTVTSKNQTTLPVAVVKVLGIKPSDQLIYELEDGHVSIRVKSGRLADLAKTPPFAPAPKRALSLDEMKRGIGRAVTLKFASKKGKRPRGRAA